jgi:hypothetical protein
MHRTSLQALSSLLPPPLTPPTPCACRHCATHCLQQHHVQLHQRLLLWQVRQQRLLRGQAPVPAQALSLPRGAAVHSQERGGWPAAFCLLPGPSVLLGFMRHLAPLACIACLTPPALSPSLATHTDHHHHHHHHPLLQENCWGGCARLTDLAKVAEANAALLNGVWTMQDYWQVQGSIYWGYNYWEGKCLPEVATRCLRHESAYHCSMDPECQYTQEQCFTDKCKTSSDPCCGRAQSTCNDAGLTGLVGACASLGGPQGTPLCCMHGTGVYVWSLLQLCCACGSAAATSLAAVLG